jgi:predicted DNA-binding transcriptional regulator YafY
MPQDKNPEEIVLSFKPTYGNYIKTLPLHPSQKIILENKNELRVSLYLFITPDFITELLSHGSRVKVLSPSFLVEELKNRLKENMAQYKN